ncbi:hypothetical protein Tco_1340991 [Tanacetum coccineum]
MFWSINRYGISISIGYGVVHDKKFNQGTIYTLQGTRTRNLFHSRSNSRRSLDESRLPDFDLFSDQEEYSKKEVTKTMAETMRQYMSKTQADLGLGVARPKIEEKDNFELKANFLRN